MVCQPCSDPAHIQEILAVTGGGTGLGLVTATALAQNGAKVYITGRREQVLLDAVKQAAPTNGRGGEIIAIQADAATKEGIVSECTDTASAYVQ
jgi:NAD(P)-dependent dehydrogenase (short-subunit alcohol dehydrogenase family)